jgi:ribosomal protein L11 methylase PrmA
VKETLDLEKGVNILDVGCGSGVWIMVNTNNNKKNTHIYYQIGHDI